MRRLKMIFDNEDQRKIIWSALNALGSNAFSSDAPIQVVAGILKVKHEVQNAEVKPPEVPPVVPPDTPPREGSNNANMEV